MKPALPAPYGDLTSATTSRAETPSITSLTTVLKAGSPARSVLLWIRISSPAGCLKFSYMIVSARPDSPGPDVSTTIVFIGDAMLSANRTTTNPSQPKIAFFLCCALHRAIRAARFLVGCELFISVLPVGGPQERSRDLDLADARRGRACGDVQRQELECF